MQCKCGREAKRHEKKTPEGIFKKYVRIECACGIVTRWACSLEGERKQVDEYLREEWALRQAQGDFETKSEVK
jgi:hypothetical protein